MLRFRFLFAAAFLALLIPVMGCGTHHRCCPSKPTDPCCPNPNLGAPPPPPVTGGF
jgi:hypothetical protein